MSSVRMSNPATLVPATAAKHFSEKELAGLIRNIAITNAFNRLNAPTRQQAGAW